MLLAGTQRFADLHDENGLMQAGKLCFALGRSQLRVEIFQFLRGDKGDFPAEVGMQLRESPAKLIARIADCGNDAANGILQIIQRTVFPGDDLFPVPLVYIDGMQVIQHFFIAADSIHIGIQSFAHVKIIIFQGKAFPFGQGMDDLEFGAAHGRDVKGNGALITVEVIIEAAVCGDEQRCGNAFEIESCTQMPLKCLLDQFDGTLRIIDGKHGMVPFGDSHSIHNGKILSHQNVFYKTGHCQSPLQLQNITISIAHKATFYNGGFTGRKTNAQCKVI